MCKRVSAVCILQPDDHDDGPENKDHQDWETALDFGRAAAHIRAPIDRVSPSRLSHDCHPRGVAAHSPDLLLHPLESGDLVPEAAVRVATLGAKEAKGPHAVVDAQIDDALLRVALA
eukprot:s2462_g5.t1